MTTVRRRLLGVAASIGLSLVAVGAALAVEPGEVLKDPALEARARALSAELRCLVCQNQSIDDSNAPLARDLRVLVRERLSAGDSDTDVMKYVVARYGEFVLLRPPMATSTLLLWLAPVLLLLGAGALIARRMWAPADATAEPQDLSAAERARLEAILAEDQVASAPKPRATITKA